LQHLNSTYLKGDKHLIRQNVPLGDGNDRITILMISHDIGAIASCVKIVGCLNRRLFYHEEKLITPEMLEMVYQCPVDLIAHGVPHRVFPLIVMLVLDPIVIALVILFYKELLAISFDETFATVANVPVDAIYLTLMCMIALTVVMMMRAEGIQRTSSTSIHWIDARAEHLPYPDAHFDGAVLFATLEFVDRPAQALHEALRVVRPDGWVIVGFLHALSAWTALYRYKADRGVMPWSAARFYPRTDIEQWMGFPAEQFKTAVYLAPQAIPPFADAERAGKRAGNAPAFEILRWRRQA